MATTDSRLKSETEHQADKAKSGIDDARSIKDAANKFSDMTGDAVQGVQQTYQDAKSVAKQNFGDVKRLIRDKPVQATLVAAGIGFLIGAFITK
jgi:ElaB/YqjD/DUF883 family membrane-anchored ribosome-binding protein